MAPLRGFPELHALARRASRRPEEADDLVQSALLAAVEAGRTDFSSPETRRWLAGVIRNRGVFEARTAARRRRRENNWALHETSAETADPRSGASEAIAGLPPSLRITALLALSGHTPAEIGWLLGLSDTALRQRITQLKRALARAEIEAGGTGPSGQLAYGRIRRALLGPVRRRDQLLASHDPDGHLFVIARPAARD